MSDPGRDDEDARGSLRRRQWQWRRQSPADNSDNSDNSDTAETALTKQAGGESVESGESEEQAHRPTSSVILLSSFVLVIIAAVVIAASVSTSGSNSDNGVALDAPTSEPTTLGGQAPVTGVTLLPGSRPPTTKAPAPHASVTSTMPAGSSHALDNAPLDSKPAPSGPTPAGEWITTPESGNIIPDMTGRHTATAANVLWATTPDYFGFFGGTNSAVTTSASVVNTAPGSSFTVSAWVFLTKATSEFETAVSQDGSENSGFYLQYSGPDNAWAFSRVNVDKATGGHGIRALSNAAPAVDAWVHLVGVFDASDNQLRLYVNGALQSRMDVNGSPQSGTATDSTPYATLGDLAIGRARWAGGGTDWWNGAIEKVEVFNQALTTSQVDALS